MPEREFRFGQVVRIKDDLKEDHREVVISSRKTSAHTLAMNEIGINAQAGGGIPFERLIPTGEVLSVEEVYRQILASDTERGINLYSTEKERETLLHLLQEIASRPSVKKRERNYHPEVREFLDRVEHEEAKDRWAFLARDYGHAAGGLANGLRMLEEAGFSRERQLEMFRSRAEELIEEYGENIIPLLSDELRDALTKEDN